MTHVHTPASKLTCFAPTQKEIVRYTVMMTMLAYKLTQHALRETVLSTVRVTTRVSAQPFNALEITVILIVIDENPVLIQQ